MFLVFLPCLLTLGAVSAQPVPILAAESVYADIAAQIAGPAALVRSILRNPVTDPHAYEPAPSTARLVAGARVVIENGIGYDGWMDRLLAASPDPDRVLINVGALLHRRMGDNDHLWFDPSAMPALQASLCLHLAGLVEDKPALAQRCRTTADALASLRVRVAQIRARVVGEKFAATEPVLGPLLAALGLEDNDPRYGLAVMNGTEPRAGDVARMEDDLKNRRVRVLIVNAQTSTPFSARLITLADERGIPVLSVSETLPAGMHYQDWMRALLGTLENALAKGRAPGP